MLAARWWGRRDVRVEEIPNPGPPPKDWVRLRVEACGICGSDLEEYVSGPVVIPTDPHPLTGRSAPLTLGHESAGIVEEAGPDSELPPGTRVAVEAVLFCGECWWCRRHQYNLCTKLAALGLSADGGLADYMLAPSYMCIPFSDRTSSDRAALSEPLAVAVRAVRRARLGLGSTVAVVGAGTVGLLTIQVARLKGAHTVIAIEKTKARRDLALELGADVAVDIEEASEAVLDLTNSVGVDVAVEAAGVPQAAAQAVRLTRKGGRAVLLGVFSGTLPIDMIDFLLGEKEVAASLSHIYDEDFLTAVKLIDSNKIEVGRLISDRIRLAEIVEKGFEPLLEDPSAHLKIIVLPNS